MFKRLVSLFGLGAETCMSAAEELAGVPLHEYNIQQAEKKIADAVKQLDIAEAQQNINKKKFDDYQFELNRYETALADAKQSYESALGAGDTSKAEEILAAANAVAAKKNTLVEKNRLMVEQYEYAMENIEECRLLIEENKAQIQAEKEMIEIVRANDSALKAHKANEDIMNRVSGIEVGGSSALSKMRSKQELEFEAQKVTRARRKEEKKATTSDLDKLNSLTSSDTPKMPW